MKPKPKPVSQITCPNPRCARPHALIWHVDVKGQRQLCYYCDRVGRQSKSKHGDETIIVLTTQRRVAPDGVVPASGLPEELTTTAAEKLNDKAQLQMPLMR